jgi:hypothetical protein
MGGRIHCCGVSRLEYFAAVHLLPLRWPKEAAVAVLFALGASLAVWTRVRTAWDVLTVLLFCCLCWINCLAIEQWEHEGEQGSHRWPVGAFAAGVALVAVLLLSEQRPILGFAEAASALAFVWLDRSRLRLSPDALRVLADVALLSPIFFLPLAGMRF